MVTKINGKKSQNKSSPAFATSIVTNNTQPQISASLNGSDARTPLVLSSSSPGTETPSPPLEVLTAERNLSQRKRKKDKNGDNQLDSESSEDLLEGITSNTTKISRNSGWWRNNW